MVAVCPNNHEMALRFASFRHIKTIWFGLKNGRDESAPTPYGMFAAIHFAHDKWFVRCMLDILLYVKTPFLYYKKGVFERQKPYFCIAKRGFLKNNNIVVCVASVVIRLEYI